MHTAFRRGFSEGQSWLFEKGVLFGVPKGSKCYGLSQVIKNAIRAGKLAEFWEWIDWIKSRTKEELEGIIKENNNEEYIRLSEHYFKQIEYYQNGHLIQYKKSLALERRHDNQLEATKLEIKGVPTDRLIASYSNSYNRKSLLATLNYLQADFSQDSTLTHPIVFILGSNTHTNVLTYYPDKKQFSYISTNDLSNPLSREITKNEDIANLLISDYSFGIDKMLDRNLSIINMRVFADEREKEKISHIMQAVQIKKEWMELHAVTLTKAFHADYLGTPWLSVASKHGQTELVSKLLEHVKNVNVENQMGQTALYYAVAYGQMDIVTLLLKAGANPNQFSKKFQEAIIFSSNDGLQILLNSHINQAFLKLSENYTTQKNQSYCSIASSVIVLNALKIKPQSLLFGKYNYFDQDNFFSDQILKKVSREEIIKNGLTLDQLGEILKNYPIKVSIIHAQIGSYHYFLKKLDETFKKPNHYMIVNFLRKKLNQPGGGHFSPIAAYDKKSDKVLLLDVARYKYHPYWVSTLDMWDAMQTVDNTSSLTRGYLLINPL